MKFLFLICVVALCSLASCQGTQKYCGRYLARTLADLCMQVDYEGTVKRGDGVVRAAGLYGTRGWRWAALGGARGKRGVVEECCDKGCSLDELFTYC